jgi:hypothetical protein
MSTNSKTKDESNMFANFLRGIAALIGIFIVLLLAKALFFGVTPQDFDLGNWWNSVCIGGSCPSGTELPIDAQGIPVMPEEVTEVAVDNCSSPYQTGWNARGITVAEGGLTARGHYVYLIKDGTGANIGNGIYATALPQNRGVLHVWSFISEECARLNQQYIHGS